MSSPYWLLTAAAPTHHRASCAAALHSSQRHVALDLVPSPRVPHLSLLLRALRLILTTLSESTSMAFILSPFPIIPRPNVSSNPRRPRMRHAQQTYMSSTPPIKLPQPPSGALAEQNPETPEQYLQSLRISPEDSRRVLSRNPRLSQISHLRQFAAPTVSYLERDLRLNARQLARAIRNAPQILYRPQSKHPPRLKFLEHVARISNEQLPAAIAKCPHILWMDLKSAAEVVAEVVEACPRITPTLLGSVFSRVPQALIANPHTIRSNLNSIREAGVNDPASMTRVLSKTPLCLVYDSKKTVAKRLVYFSQNLGFTARTIGKILVSTPEVLEWSVEKMLKPRVALLQSLVGDDALAAIVDKVPSIFGVDDILDRVLWLRDVVGLNDAQIRSVVREAPAILTYSVVGNLAPKWTFIHEAMGGTHADIVAAPRETLCANLQQRAMPRYAFLASHGRENVPVLDILRGSDSEFCRHVAKCDPETFRTYVDNDTYLLFFSQLM